MDLDMKFEDYYPQFIIKFIVFSISVGQRSEMIWIQLNFHQLNEKHDLYDDFQEATTFISVNKPSSDCKKMIKDSIKQNLLKAFPKSLCFMESIFIWNENLSRSEIINEVKNLLNYIISSFENSSSTNSTDISRGIHLSKGGRVPCLNYELITSPKCKWIFKIFNQKSGFQLFRLSCNVIAKTFLINILTDFTKNGIEYKDLQYTDDLNELNNDMNIFELFMKINPLYIPRFKEMFLAKLKGLRLPHPIIKELQSYLPEE